MAESKIYSTNVLTAGGGTLSLASGISSTPTSDGQEQTIFITCAATLSSNWTVTSTGTLSAGLQYRLVYDGTGGVILAGNTITIFGVLLTTEEANSKLEITADYNGSAFVVVIKQSEDNKEIINSGITDTTLTSGGGTITLNPYTSKFNQYLSGIATLAGSWVITGSGTSVKHSFWIYYNANLTVGVNSVTIFGIALTPAEALAGGISVYVTYDLNSSSYRAQKIPGNTSSGTGTGYNEAQVVYFDTEFGNNGSGSPNNPALQYEDYDSAASAAVALSPTSASPVWVVGKGTLNSQIILYNNVNVDITQCNNNLTTGNGQSTITDNNAAVNCIVKANNLTRSGTGTGGVAVVKTLNSGSNVTVYCNDIVSSTTTSTDGAIVCTAGTLTVYCKDITAYNYGAYSAAGILSVYSKNIASTNLTAIQNAGATQYIYCNNVNAETSGAKNASGTQYVYCNNIQVDGSGAQGSPVAGNGGTQYIFCNNITQNNLDSQAVYVSGDVVQTIEAKGTITGSGYALGAVGADDFTGTQKISAYLMQNGGIGLPYPVVFYPDTHTGTSIIKSKLKATGNGYAALISVGAGAVVNIKTDECITTNGVPVYIFDCAQASKVTLQGRFVAVGTNLDCIAIHAIGGVAADTPTIVIEGATTLVATGSGKSISSQVAATPVKVYTGVVSNKAVDTDVTQQVGTVTVSADVV